MKSKMHKSSLALMVLAAGLLIIPASLQKVNADTGNPYSKLFAFEDSEVQVEYGSGKAAEKGLATNKTGILFTSKKTGSDAEGTKINLTQKMTSNFSMDFGVFSEKTYVRGEGTGNYGYRVNTDSIELYQALAIWTQNKQNPYLDLRELAVTFTSAEDQDTWFKVFFNGSRADFTPYAISARVQTSTDSTNLGVKGYGRYGESGWPTPSWEGYNLAKGVYNTDLNSSFCNAGNETNANANSVALSFDIENMQIKANNILVRDMAGNAGLATQVSSYFGTLSNTKFKTGYTVSYEFVDVTEDNFTSNGVSMPDHQVDFGPSYAPLTEEYARHANLMVYSVNDMNFGARPAETVQTIKTIDEAVKVGDVILDATKFGDGKKAVQLTSSKTGAAAEGTSFNLEKDFSGETEFDFRVFSEKTYEAKDPTLTYTHTGEAWNANLAQVTANYANEAFNPYLDLREVEYKFTSKTDTSKWFKVLVKGGYIAGRADLASLRVIASTDGEWPYALSGYGLVGNDGWPCASWAQDSKYKTGAEYSMLGTSFSNMVVSGTNDTAKFKFDPVTMKVSGYNSGYGLCRDLAGNTGFSIFNDFFDSLSASDFAGGYTVGITFTDVTSNETVAGTLSGTETGWNSENAQYKEFSEAYDRHPNMVLYGITEGGTAVDVTKLFNTPENEAGTFADKLIADIGVDHVRPDATKWAGLATAYAALSADAKEIIAAAKIDAAESNIEKALEKYEFVCEAYNTGAVVYAEFINGRNCHYQKAITTRMQGAFDSEATNKGVLRLVGVSGYDIDEVSSFGFEIAVNGGSVKEVNNTNKGLEIFNRIHAQKGVGADEDVAYAAKDLGGKAIFGIEITGIPEGTHTLVVKAFVVESASTTRYESFQKTYTVTVGASATTVELA